MPLTLSRRHGRTREGASTCKDSKTEHDPWTKCDCMIHVQGMLAGKYLRRSTGTRSMAKAKQLVASAEDTGVWPEAVEEEDAPAVNAGVPISIVVGKFLADAASERGRNLRGSTLVKYRTLLGRVEKGEPKCGLLKYCAERNITYLHDLNVEQLRDFRDTWSTGPRATCNNIQRLRTLYRFCIENEWCEKNVAKLMRVPKKIDKTTKWPFTTDEMRAIFDAAKQAPLEGNTENAALVAFIATMRYSGLRISDVSMLKRTRLQGDDLFLFAIKGDNSQPVFASLPHWVADMLRTLPVRAKGYFFCTGSERLETNVQLWLERLNKVWDACRAQGFFGEDSPKPTSHRFRHTFASELLQSGEVDLSDVSILLGHSSVKITEQHYSRWVLKRQQQLSDSVRRAHEKGTSPIEAKN